MATRKILGSGTRSLPARILRWAILAAAVVMAGGAAFNYTALRYYRAAYPPPGQLYRVDGYNMHLYCVGSGSPPIVLESGMGDNFLLWGKVQPKLSQVTRVCSYDRAGLGWSEARPGIRDSNAVAEQLHSLLRKSGLNEPFVMMGHSIAGLHMRVYQARYSKDVAGIVFVDPATPGQFAAFGPEFDTLLQESVAGDRTKKWMAVFGVTRVLGKCGDGPPGFQAWAGWLKASDSDCDPALLSIGEREIAAFALSGQEAAPTGPWGNLPILILSADPEEWGKDMGFAEALRKKWAAAWSSLHEGLKQMSTRSRRVIARGSHHYVQIDRPELVIEEAEQFIRGLRDSARADSGGVPTVLR